MPTLEISKITLPSGNTYDIKDTVARQMASGAIHLVGTTTTPLSDNATTNPIIVNGESYTAEANDAVFYGDQEYVFDGTYWHKFGDMSGVGAMGKVDTGTVTIKPKGTNAASSVSFAAHTTKDVIGKNATGTVPKAVGTTKYLTGSATGTAVDVATSGSALTGLGSPTTVSFVKSYPGVTSKLVTDTITGVQASTTTASKATAGTAVAVAKAGTAVNVSDGTLGNETTTRTANTPMWGATVENETLKFTYKPINANTSITPAVSNGNITPYTFNDVDVPIKAAAASTFATGALANNGGGASVMTGLGTPTTDKGVTGYGSPTSDTFAKTVSITTQPTITLTGSATQTTGAIKYVEEVTESGTNSVTWTDKDIAGAITTLGAATAAGQTFTGTQETYTVYPDNS